MAIIVPHTALTRGGGGERKREGFPSFQIVVAGEEKKGGKKKKDQ